MAKQAFIYCPQCARVGLKTSELFTEMPETHVFRCMNGHAFEREPLMALQPELMKLHVTEKAQPGQIKAEFWVDREVYEKVRAAKPEQMSATVNSILGLYAMGSDPIIVDAVQAAKMKALGVHTGQEMLATVEMAKSLEDQLNTAQEKIAIFQGMFNAAGAQSPV